MRPPPPEGSNDRGGGSVRRPNSGGRVDEQQSLISANRADANFPEPAVVSQRPERWRFDFEASVTEGLVQNPSLSI